ncbi:hypothetical protein ACTJKO_03705 [Curtobacterium sp. 22159]|uniref:hypothetical protein n=1 Tax=Curtobacterium sp. 22159 TaxID=3453882 RepID=UPI003F83CADC
MADDDVAAERARLEAIAWGGATSDAEAAEARAALEQLGRHRRHHAPAAPAPALERAVPTPGPTGADEHDEPGGDETTVTHADGAEPRLPGHDRTARAPWMGRPRIWITLGVAAAVGVAFAAGTVVGTSRPDTAAAPSVTPSAGTITLEDLLDEPQTYADQLPGPVEAPVSLRTTRLIFTNRELDGGSLQTPWAVWAGVGTDRSTICLVATANRLESTSACYPRADALHGSVSLSAQSMSGTLTLTLRGGGVQGTVTNEN